MRETAQSFTSVLRSESFPSGSGDNGYSVIRDTLEPFSWLSGRRKHGYERANVDGDETMEMTEDTR
jgi:hypothetical protein